MSYSRSVFAAAVALCAALPAPAAATPAPAVIELSASGQRALKPSALTVASVPRGPKKTTLWLATGKATIGSSATVAFTGSLRFTAGRRKADVTALQLTLGRTSSSISAKVGKQRVRLFTVTPTRPAELDAAAGRLALTRAKVALTPAAAKALRSTLKLKRTPSTKALGTFSIAIAPERSPVAAPAPITAPAPAPTATATPVPTATPTPDAAALCAQRVAVTPAESVDWFGCDRPGNGDLKSWTNYIQQDFPPFPCPGGAGSITPAGVTRIAADSPYDHRFAIGSTTVRPDGSATITTSGSITYRMPVHGIEESIGAFRIEIAAGGLTGTVYADGTAKARDMSGAGCATPPTAYTAQPVFTLDFAGRPSVTADGVRRWVQVPATLTATGKPLVGGGTYPVGTVYSSFTIAIPTP